MRETQGSNQSTLPVLSGDTKHRSPNNPSPALVYRIIYIADKTLLPFAQLERPALPFATWNRQALDKRYDFIRPGWRASLATPPAHR
jgi:hypothetical protein